MVLLLKQWKSRSPPGFEAGALSNPFAIQKRPLLGFPGGGLFRLYRAKVFKAVRLRKAERPPGPAYAGRIEARRMPAPAPEA